MTACKTLGLFVQHKNMTIHDREQTQHLSEISANAKDSFLFISDDVRRTDRLTRDLQSNYKCCVHDLYDDRLPTSGFSFMISDILQLSSDALVRLRRCLQSARTPSMPFLFLVHSNPARAEIQAQLLGATATLSAAAASRALLERYARNVHPSCAVSTGTSAERHVHQAEQFLKDVFFTDTPVTVTLAEVGTSLVAHAVRETGIQDWVRAVQRFDDVTHQHILLVAGLAAAFASALRLNSIDQHLLTKAALLHDVGKTRIPMAILNKPGKLNDDELRVMRTHPLLGHAMLTDSGFDAITLMVVRSHHEMLDGSGYPDGLQGVQIPDLVRLVSICDIYAALIERRPYKLPLSAEKSFAMLEGMAGRLDSDLVRAFKPVADAFRSVAVSAA